MLIFLSMLESDEERRLFTDLYNQYGNMMLHVAKRYFPKRYVCGRRRRSKCVDTCNHLILHYKIVDFLEEPLDRVNTEKSWNLLYEKSLRIMLLCQIHISLNREL